MSLGRTLCLLSCALSCAPLTFSKEAAVDYRRYAVIRSEVAGPDGSLNHSEYLEQELQAHSGFRSVTRDPRVQVDAVLSVELTLDFSRDGIFSDDDTTYSAYVSYRLMDPAGRTLDSGAASSPDEADVFEAAEAALDQVVLRYLPAYRL